MTTAVLTERTDSEIEHDAVRALELRPGSPLAIGIWVRDGCAILSGEVEWLHQKFDVERRMRTVPGVAGIVNEIEVAPHSRARAVYERILKALHQEGEGDRPSISVAVEGNVAILTGTVISLMERDAAERAAASAPGITRVDNCIDVMPKPDHDATEIALAHDPFHDPAMGLVAIALMVAALVLLVGMALVYWGVSYTAPPWNVYSVPPPDAPY